MPLSKILFREKTNVPIKKPIVFTTPGIYYPPYGKTTFLLEAQGTPGNSPTGGTTSTTNPATGGTYAGTNASTPGTYAGTNPTTGHNVISQGNYVAAVTGYGGNVATQGNYVAAVPSSGGTVLQAAYTNTAYANIKDFQTYYLQGAGVAYRNYIFSGSLPLPSNTAYVLGTYMGEWHNFSVVSYITPSTTNTAYYNPYVAGTGAYSNPTYYNFFQPPVAAYTNPTYFNPTIAGNAYYNPTIAGNAYYNPTVPGNANAAGSNPTTGGNFAGYNPSTGGNILVEGTYVAGTPNIPAYNNITYYNTFVEGISYNNPVVTGTTAYTPYVAGNAGSSTNVLGITLPGGAAATAAPVIGYVPVVVDYSSSGIPITVPSGGYVKIKNI